MDVDRAPLASTAPENRTSPPAVSERTFGRVFNFAAGPAMLPLEVLEQAREELTDWGGCGMSVMEVSHRSKAFRCGRSRVPPGCRPGREVIDSNPDR